MPITNTQTAQIIAQQQGAAAGMWPNSPPAGYGGPAPDALSAPGVVPGPGTGYAAPQEPSMADIMTPTYDPRNPPAIMGQGPGPNVYGQPGGQPLSNIAGGVAAQGMGMAITGVGSGMGALAFGSMMIGDVPLGKSLLPHPTNIMDPYMGAAHGATLGMRGALATGGVDLGDVGEGFWKTLKGVGSQMTSGAAGRQVGMRALGAGAAGAGIAALPYMAAQEAFSFAAENLLIGGQQQMAQQNFWSQVPRSAMPHMAGKMGTDWSQGVGDMMRDMSFKDKSLDVGEMQGLMSSMVGSGQMFDVQGLSDFEHKFKQGMDSLKIVARTMNTTLTDAQSFLEEQKQIGFLSPQAGAMNISYGRGVAVTSGLQSGTMPVIASQGAQVGWQMGMTRSQGAVMAEQNVANMGYQVMSGGVSRNELMEATGTSNYDEAMASFSGTMLQTGAQYTKGKRGQLWTAALANEDVTGIDPVKAQLAAQGGYSDDQLKAMAKQTRERGGKTGRMRLKYQPEEFQQDLMQMVDPTQMISQDIKGMIDERYGNMDPEQQGIMEEVLMEKYAGLGKRDAALVRKMGEQSPIVRQEIKNKIMAEMQTSQIPEVNIDMIWEGVKQKYVGQYLDPVKQQLQQYGSQITAFGSGIVEDVMKDVLGVESVTIGAGGDRAREMSGLGYSNMAHQYDPYAAMQRREQKMGGTGFGGAPSLASVARGAPFTSTAGFGPDYSGGWGASDWEQQSAGGGFSGAFPITSMGLQMGAPGGAMMGAGWGVTQGGSAVGGALGKIPTVGSALEAGVGGLTGNIGRGMGNLGKLALAPGRAAVNAGQVGLGAAGGVGAMEVGAAFAAAPGTAAFAVAGAGLGGYEVGNAYMNLAGYGMPSGTDDLSDFQLADIAASGGTRGEYFRTTYDIDEMKLGKGERITSTEYAMGGPVDIGKNLLGNLVGPMAYLVGGTEAKKMTDKIFQPLGIAKVTDMGLYETQYTAALRGGSIEEALSYGDAYKKMKQAPSDSELASAFSAEMDKLGATIPDMEGKTPLQKARYTLKIAKESGNPVLEQYADAALSDPRNILSGATYLHEAWSNSNDGGKLGFAPTRDEVSEVVKGWVDSSKKSGGNIYSDVFSLVSDSSLLKDYEGGAAVSRSLQGIKSEDDAKSWTPWTESTNKDLEKYTTPFNIKKTFDIGARSVAKGLGLDAGAADFLSDIADMSGLFNPIVGGGIKEFASEADKLSKGVDSETFNKIFDGNFDDAPPGAVQIFNKLALYANAGAMGELTQSQKADMTGLLQLSTESIAEQYGMSEEDARATKAYARTLTTASKDELEGFAKGLSPAVFAQKQNEQKALAGKYITSYETGFKRKRGEIEGALRGGELGEGAGEMLDIMDQIVNQYKTNGEAGDLQLKFNKLAIENPDAAAYIASQSDSSGISGMISGGGEMSKFWKGRLQTGRGDDVTGVGLEDAIKSIYGGVDQKVLQDILVTGRGEDKKMKRLGIREQGRLTDALSGTGMDKTQAGAITNLVARYYEDGELDKADSEELATRLANSGLSPQVAGEIMTGKKGGLSEFVESLAPATENLETFNKQIANFNERTAGHPMFQDK